MQTHSENPDRLLLSELIGAVGIALDLTATRPEGHVFRSCWVGMYMGWELGLQQAELTDLYYCLLLKDVGSGAADAAPLLSVRPDAEKQPPTPRHSVFEQRTRAAGIATKLGFHRSVADAIFSLEEHWDASGFPEGMRGEQTPLASRIAYLAQTFDTLHGESDQSLALQWIQERREAWFDPSLVDCLRKLCLQDHFVDGLRSPGLQERVVMLEPRRMAVDVSEDRLDCVAQALAEVLDAKSPFTAGHSTRVSELAARIGKHLGHNQEQVLFLRRAGLLHDVGKLGVSNSILNKPGRLDAAERIIANQHASFTETILKRIGPFGQLAKIAGSHHEKLDGKGFPRGLAGDEIELDARILAVADIFDALTTDRPYRQGMPLAKALGILEEARASELDPRCLDALLDVLREDGHEIEAA